MTSSDKVPNPIVCDCKGSQSLYRAEHAFACASLQEISAELIAEVAEDPR